jgi:accessory gene regulator B
MLERLSRQVVCTWVQQGIVSEEDRDTYVYGVELALSTTLNFICIVMIGILFQNTFSFVPFLLAFIPLRMIGGGFHAKSHLSCTLCTVVIFCLSLVVAQQPMGNYSGLFCIVITIIASVIFLVLAPVASFNKPLNEYEHRRNRHITLLFQLIILVIVLFKLSCCDEAGLTLKLFCLGDFMAAFSLLIGRIANDRNHII